jgi:integrase
LLELWELYVAKRQKDGSMQDGGRRQVLAVKSLIDVTGKSNANDLTKEDIHAWHDDLLTKLSVRTIAKVYLPTIRSLFSWAVKRDLMAVNPADDVRQVAPKSVRSRESGYTDSEALVQLTAALTYRPKVSSQGKALENIKVTAAKRWVPLLCTFTGARIGELTQLRREDLRHEQGSWIARITPDAGSVKTKQYRDVPLHPQLIELGFSDYFEGLANGPIFNMPPEPSRNRIHSQKLAKRLRDWLHEEKLVPKDLQPCHGWRHRFKTVGIELGISERVIDAVQGHAGRRAADDYGDVTIKARCEAIERYPAFNLGGAAAERGRTGQTSER